MPVEIEVHTEPHFKAPVHCTKGCWHFYVVKQHCQFGQISTKNGFIHFPMNTIVGLIT